MRPKIKISNLAANPSDVFEVRVNLLCLAEWERETGRRLADGLAFGYTEIIWWAWFMTRLAGKTATATPAAFVAENPEADLEIIEYGTGNPTVGAPTDAN